MTIPVSNRLSQLYVGNGVNTRFDFTFRAFGQEDETGIAVRVKDSNGFEFIDSDLYSVNVNQDGVGGYITFTNPPSASTYFYIIGNTSVDQLLDITNYDNFYPDAIERALDKITAILQERNSLLDLEVQARTLADINYDLLAQARETDLKNYIDTIVANITDAPLAESQFVTYVDSVNELPSLLKWNGRVAYVKNISHFEYNESTDDWVLKVTPIESGGTGGTTAEEARNNLEVYSKTQVDTLLEDLPAQGGGGGLKKLKISSLGINNYISVITADSVTLHKSTGESYLAKNVNVSPQINASGVNGLDAGSVVANTWYYLYLISDGTLVRGLFSLSATAPTLPSGYTYFTRIGAVRAGASGHLLQTLQYGNKAQYVVTTGSNVASLPILSSGAFGSYSTTSPTYVAISTSNVVPPTASKITGVLCNASTGTTSSVGLAPNSNYSGIGTSNPPLIHAISGNAGSRVFTYVLETSNIYAYSSTSAGLIQCLGWEDNL